MGIRVFGRDAAGEDVPEVTIAADGLTARIIGYGASLRDLRLDGVAHPLVLGYETLEAYLAHGAHFGAIAGRYANRIAGGRFSLDGRSHQLTRNEDGRTHIHGGRQGYGHRFWTLADHDSASATLTLAEPDGAEGYPGAVSVSCRYSIAAPATLRIELTATTDAPTIVNLAQHSYFNLDGGDDILDHRLTIPAETYTPVDAAKIPTGELRPVADTAFDFRRSRPIRREEDGERVRYDHNFVVRPARQAEPGPAARLESDRSGVALAIASTEPGMQFYDGHMLVSPAAGLGGRRYSASAGCCLESQVFPDAPNHAGFPSAVLRPGETYRQVTLLAFSRS